ncbi:cationic amino acid transporter [Striga asiatica]|uniref:Cationic amino acid transporter n=1 Tax=Striga asiatica TaxID=4170 RepID=A0A5A7P4Y2_STRAF|nr:cationic amino acid transporter [Striga asiatica]
MTRNQKRLKDDQHCGGAERLAGRRRPEKRRLGFFFDKLGVKPHNWKVSEIICGPVMGIFSDTEKNGCGTRENSSDCSLRNLVRRKQVDSKHTRSSSSSGNVQHQLAKALTAPHLIAIGVGATIGSGVYILVGTVAREHSGPGLTLSFLIAGIAAGLSAFCYAELASRCPSAGSAYHYSYICIGEVFAWLIGWALMLEYTIGASAVARGISPNLALLFGSPDSLPSFLARQTIPGFNIVVDPCAAILVIVVTGLLCLGIKESALVQGVVTSVNTCALIFIIVVGGYLGFKTGWCGYGLPTGYFPFGAQGMLAGASTVFFAYTGFDSVTSTAEETVEMKPKFSFPVVKVLISTFVLLFQLLRELLIIVCLIRVILKHNVVSGSLINDVLYYQVKNPEKDLPMGIGIALSICCTLYMLVSAVIVGLVPYYSMDPDTPISSAFSSHGIRWAAYVITIGSCTALCSSLMGSLLPQSRIQMAMARDGLLPSLFSDVNKSTQVPVKSTVVTGLVATILAFFMDVEQLSGMVSLGTLVAYTVVAISVLILRYVPPNKVPVPSSFQEAINSVSLRHAGSYSCEDILNENTKVYAITTEKSPLLVRREATVKYRLINGAYDFFVNKKNRRKIAGWAIMVTCVGVIVLTSATSSSTLCSTLRYTLCGFGIALLFCGLILLTCIEQDDARHDFGHRGGFMCPFVPLLPVACILINVYLLVNLSGGTWARVTIWWALALVVYFLYGRKHSVLRHAVYVPSSHVDEIYQTSTNSISESAASIDDEKL